MSIQLPVRSHLVHKAIDPEKLSKKIAYQLTDADGAAYYGKYFYQKKYDGCSVIIIRDYDGKVYYFSRDGKEVLSLGHLTKTLQRVTLGTVFFAEAWFPNAEHRVINGTFRRKTTQEILELRVFDTIPLRDFQNGHCSTPYSVRRTHVLDLTTYWMRRDTRILPSEDCNPWDVAALASHPTDAYDGAVAWLRDGTWTAGAGRGGEILKQKNIVDLDLEVVEVYEGEGKHAGRLGAIGVRFANGVVLRVGTGFSDLEREAWWRDPLDIKGRIVRIVGMKDSGKGSIREPRFKGIRFDKTEADY